MSRTRKAEKYNSYRKEAKWARKLSNQETRYHNRDVVRAVQANACDPEDISYEEPPRTSGWITW
jgi:hypothetical protein